MSNAISIKHHNFIPHRRAVQAIEAAIAGLDRELRGLARRQDLYPGERVQRERAAREEAEGKVRTARAELVQAIAHSKQLATYAPDAPADTGRAAYYAQQAQAELSGLRPDQQLAVVQRVVASGDVERAQEFVRAARGPLVNSEHAGELRRLERAVTPRDAVVHRAWGSAMESVEGNLGWLDRWIADDLSAAGRVSSAVRAGLEPEVPMDTGKISKWLPRVEREAAVAFSRRAAEQDGVEPPVWARPRTVHGDGQSDAPEGAAPADGAV